MKCPNCHSENPKSAKFCVECGHKLEVKCPKCGFGNSHSFKFCAECGHNINLPSEQEPKDLSFDEKLEKIQRYLPKGLTEKILSQRDRIEGERKQVTVMFCDMEGFTALSERIGPEEAYSIIDQIYEILIHKVHDYGGTVNEMTGDGIVALFGAPIALEDAPQRAIRSALAIHREMVNFDEQIKKDTQIQPLRMRIGIHTGPVVVGTVGNDLRVEFKAIGDTVNLASRIEKIAEPGATYVTEETFKLAQGIFRFEGLGGFRIKGKEKPIKVYQALAPSSRRTRFDVSSELGLTPFIGRERELELLLDGFERAKEGKGQAFSIVAEAGLGKSRLLYEFRKAIANENVTFLEGKCMSYSRNVAYHPVIDILKTNFNIHESDVDTKIREKVKTSLRNLEIDESANLPYLLELLSVRDSGIDEIAINLEAKKDRTFESLRQIVLKGSERRAIIIAVEDLHWIDKTSEESFKRLLEGIAGARILLIFTYRPEFVHTWGGRSYHNQVTLNRLSNRESLAMVSYLLGTQDIERNLESFILGKTEGVPFFIEEFIRSLKDLKGIERKEGELCLADDLQDVDIPSRIQDVIMARVDSLPEGAKETLQLGSVIGREFDHDLLVRIIGFSEQELLSRLSILKDSELLYERGVYPQSAYIFKHALTQESVYQSLLKSTRHKYHHIVAEVLEQHFSEKKEFQPEILSYHFSAADLSEKAIYYSHRAGEIAVKRSANDEAIDHLSRGLELLKTLPETNERNQQELSLQIALGPPLSVVKGPSSLEMEHTLFRAKDLCGKIGDLKHLCAVLRGLVRLYVFRAEYKTAITFAEKSLQIAESEQDSLSYLVAHRSLGSTKHFLGNITGAQFHFEQVISFYDSKIHNYTAVLPGADVAVHSLVFLSNISWMLGYPEKAIEKSKKAVALADKLSHPLSIAVALLSVGSIDSFYGNFRNAQESYEKSIEISKRYRLKTWIAVGERWQGWAMAMQDKEEIGISIMVKASSFLKSIGHELGRVSENCRFATVLSKAGKIEESFQTIIEAELLMNKTDERTWEAELFRLKGELLLAMSIEDQNDAESCFLKSLEISRRQETKSFELRAAISLSRLWQNKGKSKEARILLSEIYGWFAEGFDTADLKDAKALLDELS